MLGTGTQLNGKSTINSLEEIVAEDEGDEIFQIHDVLSIDQEDPAVKAARRLDWDELLGSLTERERMLVESMLAGKNRVQAARSIGVSTWTITHDKMDLAKKILEYMGADNCFTSASILSSVCMVQLNPKPAGLQLPCSLPNAAMANGNQVKDRQG